MEATGVRLYPYRWVMLGIFMLINVMVQVLWIGYAPIATLAAAAYGVKREDIDLLANMFMLIYILAAFPAAWAIDTYGFRKAVGFGAVLMGAFGLLRALFPTNYTMAVVGSVGISIGQPFLLNAFTKLAALWFPQKHRATVTGVIFLALFLGIGLGEVLGPVLVSACGFAGLQLIYGGAAAASALVFVLLARSGPPTPASPPGEEVRALVLDSLKQILKDRNVHILSLALFLASGIVNALFTLIDGLDSDLSLTVDQGVTLTALLLAGGIVGSLAIPAVSDALGSRKVVLIVAIFLAVPATLGLVLGRGFAFEVVCFFVMGFAVTGVTPVAYQYGAEITFPAPEGTSNGVFALVVQASGLLIVLMDALRDAFHDSYIPSFVGLAVLLGGTAFFMLSLSESPKMAPTPATPEPESMSEAL